MQSVLLSVLCVPEPLLRPCPPSHCCIPTHCLPLDGAHALSFTGGHSVADLVVMIGLFMSLLRQLVALAFLLLLIL